MALYYLDIETTGFDAEQDKIVSIQYQEVNDLGEPSGELSILKEWDSDEKTIVTNIWDKIVMGNSWFFIPVGSNLIFDLTFLWAKFEKYSLYAPTLSEFLFNKPLIDIKYTLIIMNNLQFKGSGLDKMTNKKTDGRNIPIWYKEKKYDLIENYIKQEAESFLEFFKMLANELPKLVKK